MTVHLQQFILDNLDSLLDEWDDFARTVEPAAKTMSAKELRNGARAILETIAAEMSGVQTASEKKARSRGRLQRPGSSASAGDVHGADRLAQGFDLEQLVSEYRALRASVIRLWAEKEGESDPAVDELTRFNEAIDEALADSLRRYSAEFNHSRELVMAVLGHDLRSPLGAILNSAKSLLAMTGSDNLQKKAASLILSSARRMGAMVADLLDFTRTRLGDALPVERRQMDFAEVCRHTVAELEAANPNAKLVLEATGNLEGSWDAARMAQLLSNLIDNAIQHGTPGNPIEITMVGEAGSVVLAVHNEGTPIAASDQERIFEALAKAPTDRPNPSSLGLGLYISREIARAHAGTIAVASSKGAGTTFTVRLPKREP